VENECRIVYNKLMACDLFELEGFKRIMNTPHHGPMTDIEVDALVRSLVGSYQENVEQDGDEHTKTDKRKVKGDTYIKVSKRKIDDLLNAVSELIILHAQLVNVMTGIQSPVLSEVTERLEGITNNLRDTGLEIGLVPIETLVTKFKRVVRDLAKSLNKKVNFLSEGAETEMDKDLIELMFEPMIHIIRNAIDHGIESPLERSAAGKSEHGTVRFKAFNTNAYVNIVISDDGRGIDRERVLQKAIEKQLISPDAQLTEDETLNLIFHSGLSTATAISDVSGRGVGMDVVKQKINDLRGYVSVKSTPGKGTAIHIKLPLSRSIIEGLLLRVDETRYVMPLNVIDRIDRVLYESLASEVRVNNAVTINEEMLAVFSIRQHFHPDSKAPKTADILSVNINGLKRGIAVDRIEGKVQTVMKPLGEVYQQLDFIAGSSILGDGSLALVLDPSRLFSSHTRQTIR
jgi:two-component system chemotaxis sensor kinase CheA